MSIVVYGEIALDWLIAHNGVIRYRIGGAGLYGALSAAKSGAKVELLTLLSPEIDQYYISVWNDIGISLNYAKFDTNYNIPKYLASGFENYRKKVSIPMNSLKSGYEYFPEIPEELEAILVFPINNSLPIDICINAKNEKKMVFLDPKPNAKSIADAKRMLGYVDGLLINEEELLLLSCKNEISECIAELLNAGPKYIIVKRGVKGCIVAEKGKKLVIIPSYKSNAICTLGSGDVFDGALVTTFVESGDIEYSVRFASCMAALFIESIEIEQMPNKRAIQNYLDKREIIKYDSFRDINIYLAGPFFSQQELQWVNYMQGCLEGCGLHVFSPSKENGIIDADSCFERRKDIFRMDLELLLKSDIVVALLDYSDSGTSFEIGYAYSNNIPVIGLKTSNDKLNNMIRFGCEIICNSIEKLVTEVYKYATQ